MWKSLKKWKFDDSGSKIGSKIESIFSRFQYVPKENQGQKTGPKNIIVKLDSQMTSKMVKKCRFLGTAYLRLGEFFSLFNTSVKFCKILVKFWKFETFFWFLFDAEKDPFLITTQGHQIRVICDQSGFREIL